MRQHRHRIARRHRDAHRRAKPFRIYAGLGGGMLVAADERAPLFASAKPATKRRWELDAVFVHIPDGMSGCAGARLD